MYELIFYMILLFINILFAFKQMPIVSVPIALFSFYIGATQFLTDTTNIPYNPFSTVFFLVICLVNILANALSLGE